VTRTAPAGGAPEVVPAMYTHVSTHKDARTFEWANLAVLFNQSDYGNNVRRTRRRASSAKASPGAA
jgi:hypothetical protein